MDCTYTRGRLPVSLHLSAFFEIVETNVISFAQAPLP